MDIFNKTYHLCNGTIERPYFEGNNLKTMRDECGTSHKLYFSVDYKIYSLKIGECCRTHVSDIQRMVMEEVFKKEVIATHHVPKYNAGDNWIAEICYFNESNWRYYIKTPINSIPNFWSSFKDPFQWEKKIYGRYLVEENRHVLAKSQLISHRADPFEIKISDLNKITNFLTKQINNYEL